jgi:HtrA serine peptidase 2
MRRATRSRIPTLLAAAAKADGTTAAATTTAATAGMARRLGTEAPQSPSAAFRWARPALLVLSGYALGAATRRGTDGSLEFTLPWPLGVAQMAQAPPPSGLLPSSTSSVPLAGCLSPFFIADAAAKAAPAVVNILVQHGGAVPSGSSGSGFIVSKDGTVLTNAHVVADALPGGFGGPGLLSRENYSSCDNDARAITVTLQDGRIYEATVAAHDWISDLAVLKIKEAEGLLPMARLGASAGLRVGEWVVTLGSPLHLQNSVTAGIVSCVDRKGTELGLAGARTEYIQTDAAINRGSSGGPLVNLAGEVVGVSCMKALAADGVSFAIPIDTVREVVAQLETRGRVVRPYIGVKLLQLSGNSVAAMRRRDPGFPPLRGGVLVPAVAPGSPAARAGLREGDVILRVGDSGEATAGALVKALEGSIGRELALEVLRPDGKGGGETLRLKVVAEEAGQQPTAQREGGSGGKG